MSGRGKGSGGGRGGGRGRGSGPGRMGGPKAGGPGGYCVCPQCGNKIEHTVAKPCYEVKCPECGTLMTRE